MNRLFRLLLNHRLLALVASALGMTFGSAITVPAAAQSSLEERLEQVRRETEARQQRQAAVPGELTPVKMLQKLFYDEVTVNFIDTPVKDAIEFLSDSLGVRIVGRYADDATANGINPAHTITLQAEDMTAFAALDFILAVCSSTDECTWQLRNGYIEVGPKDRLAMGSAQTVKSYPITDLLMEVPDFDNMPPMDLGEQLAGGGLGYYGGYSDWYGPYRYGYTPGSRIVRGGAYGGYGGGRSGSINPGATGNQRPLDKRAAMKQKAEELMAFIKSIVEPGHWRDEGGDWASIAYYDGVLVIRAPEFIHRQIGGYPKIPNPNDHGGGEGDDDDEADASGAGGR